MICARLFKPGSVVQKSILQPQLWIVTARSSVRSNHSRIERIKDFIFATDKETFHPDFVFRAHKWDSVNRAEWKLIYRDIGASRSFMMSAIFLPMAVCGAIVCLWDINTHRKEDRLDIVQRLTKDVEEIGVLAVFPGIAVCLVVLSLLRIHHSRLLRIYQNRQNVDKFMAIGSKGVVGQKKVLFDREVSSAFYYEATQGEMTRMALHFVFGNIQIGRSKFLVMDDCFIGNNFRSYMLNETSIPPRLVEQVVVKR